MSIDWHRLARLRERQQMLAQQEVARERTAAQASDDALQQAQAGLALEQLHKRTLWRQQQEASSLSVEHLRQASAWSRALDARIARAAVDVGAAQVRAQAQHAALDAAREAMQRMARERHKAQAMGERTHRAARQVRERRIDDGIDEVSVQVLRSGAGD